MGPVSQGSAGKTLRAVTQVLFPPHAFGNAAKLLDWAVGHQAERLVDGIDEQFLARLDLQFFTERLGDNDLKLGGDFYLFSFHYASRQLICRLFGSTRIDAGFLHYCESLWN